jgi:hypothetical protein
MNKFLVYLAKIKTASDGTKKFVKAEVPHKETTWGTPYNSFFFKLRRAYFNKPNCNMNCPPNREFFCCKTMGCMKNCGFFEWLEIAFFSDKEIEAILSLWDDEMGFQGENGCVLPRELRSYICLNFACRYSMENKK